MKFLVLFLHCCCAPNFSCDSLTRRLRLYVEVLLFLQGMIEAQ
ncbi:hypothetical protein GLYMA_20G194251v4 [Glycine max]|nr:hypothetical protein GLYMA_20G194251v4 [Glycine max]KAH1036950.1 hypothetical protein GYH30_056390 [Glycine max]